MTKAQYRRECEIVSVLSDLLAQSIRSTARPGKAADKLEADVEALPARFAAVTKGVVSTAAERAIYRRNIRKLLKVRHG